MNPSNLDQHRAIRARILRALYQEREQRAGAAGAAAGLWQRDVETVAGGDAHFDLGYLIERGLVRRDGLRLSITAEGIDRVEAEGQ